MYICKGCQVGYGLGRQEAKMKNVAKNAVTIIQVHILLK